MLIGSTKFEKITWPILDNVIQVHCLGHIFDRKRSFCLLAPPNQTPFLTISKKNIPFKTKA